MTHGRCGGWHSVVPFRGSVSMDKGLSLEMNPQKIPREAALGTSPLTLKGRFTKNFSCC